MPDGGGSVALRRDRTRGGIERLGRMLEAWMKSWAGHPAQNSQIARCGATLRAMIDRLRERSAALPTDETAFAACRALDADALVVELLQRTYAQRFDQRRGGDALAAALAAADELIWSCVLQTHPLGATPPIPLAYIEPAYVATATPRTKPPTSLPVRDRALAEALRVLPIPLIGLPAGIVGEPWWLALLAHEVGHHVQYDLDPGALARTEALLGAVGAEWVPWATEIFADAFAVRAIGPAAIEMVAELEWGDAAAMTAPRDKYPPVIVRLALLAELARASGFADPPFGPGAWADLVARAGADGAKAAAQLAVVADLAPKLLAMPVGLATLADVADPAAAGALDDPAILARLGGAASVLERARGAPRLVASLAFRRFRALAAEADEALRTTAAEDLRVRTLPLYVEAAPDRTVLRGGHGEEGLFGTARKDAERVFDALRALEQE